MDGPLGSEGDQLRIAVIEPVGEGGFAHFTDEHCTALGLVGAEVRLFTSSRYAEGEERPYTVDRGMRLWPAYEPVPLGEPRHTGWQRIRRRMRRPIRAARLAVQVWRAARRSLEWRPDVVQVTRAEHNPVSALVRRRCRRAGVLVVELVHEFGDREHRRGIALGPSLAAVTDRWSPPDGYVVLSHTVRDTLIERRGIDPSKVALVPFGIAPIGAPDPDLVHAARQRYDTDRRPLLFTFGTIRPSKGIPVLLDALARLPPELDHTTLIAGHPTAAVRPESLVQRALALGLGERVVFDFRFLERDELASLLEIASAVVLPYLSASQSAVLHQAQAQGVPVIASAVGAVSDDVRDGVDGRLVPPGDAEALAHAIAHLLSSPEERATLRAGADALRAERAGWLPTGTAVVDAYSRWALRA